MCAGYTRFTSEQGDEAGARLAARFAEVVREQIESRGGTVVELRGDEALCVFGSPRGALRAAVDLQRRCADELRADPSLPLRVGIGIDAGEAVAVAGGYRGGALNLAARLCSIAGPGEVLVSEGIVHLARHVDEMSYVDRGRVELKGMDRAGARDAGQVRAGHAGGCERCRPAVDAGAVGGAGGVA